jgi:hypothetical protein
MMENNPYQTTARLRETVIALTMPITAVSAVDVDDWALHFKRTWRRDKLTVLSVLCFAVLLAIATYQSSLTPIGWIIAILFFGGFVFAFNSPKAYAAQLLKKANHLSGETRFVIDDRSILIQHHSGERWHYLWVAIYAMGFRRESVMIQIDSIGPSLLLTRQSIGDRWDELCSALKPMIAENKANKCAIKHGDYETDQRESSIQFKAENKLDSKWTYNHRLDHRRSSVRTQVVGTA